MLGWCSVGTVVCALIPAVLMAAGITHSWCRIALITLLSIGSIGLMVWYIRVRQAIRKLNGLNDTLERHSLEQEETLKKLKELEKAKKTFMHMSSHQLRAPLAAMQSCMRVLMTGDVKDKEDKQKLLHDAYTRGEDMMELVNDLLQLSEAESLASLKKDAVVEEIDVEKTVREIAEFFAPRAAEKNVTIVVNVKSPAGTLLANKKMFNQLVLNLVSNAFRYSDPDKQVVVKLSGSSKTLVIIVKNWGLVIPTEEKENIFKEFWRGKEARKFVERGSGLGLSIVKNIVDTWGGWISVESDPARGTRFTVEIPKNIGKGGNSNGKEKSSNH